MVKDQQLFHLGLQNRQVSFVRIRSIECSECGVSSKNVGHIWEGGIIGRVWVCVGNVGVNRVVLGCDKA